MKKRIISGSSSLLLLSSYLLVEIGCVLLCCLADVTYILLVFWSVVFAFVLIVYNRIVTIVTYDFEKKLVARRGLLWGFHKEVRVADIIRTEVRMIPKEQEYILLIDNEVDCIESLSPDMPIRVPNTAKGRAFVAKFWVQSSDVVGETGQSSK